jgi:rod shape-determining protein MreC
MALLDARPKAGYLFLAAVISHLVLISAQVSSKTGVPILNAFTLGTFGEVQRATGTVVGTIRAGWNGYVSLRSIYLENEVLRKRLEHAEVELQQERALADRTRNLEALLGLSQSLELQTTAARIIGGSASPDFRTVTIDKGSNQGIKTDMAVISPSGAVGRVILAGARASRVQLLIDRNAAAGALVARSRAQGVAVGAGDDRMRLEYASQAADVTAGDTLVTSGIDGIYPKGIVIGRVQTVERGVAYPTIVIQPEVDFSRLEDVLVVLTPVLVETTGAKPE